MFKSLHIIQRFSQLSNRVVTSIGYFQFILVTFMLLRWGYFNCWDFLRAGGVGSRLGRLVVRGVEVPHAH